MINVQFLNCFAVRFDASVTKIMKNIVQKVSLNICKKSDEKRNKFISSKKTNNPIVFKVLYL